MITVKIAPIAVAAALIITACEPAVQTTEREPGPPRTKPSVQTSERAEPVEPVESPSPTEPEVVGGENVEEFFRALASQDPRKMKAMTGFAADDSPAQIYAKVQYALLVAQQQSYGGGMVGPQVMRVTDDGGIRLSSEPMGFEGDIEQVVNYTGFELTDGKIASFSVSTPEDPDPISIDKRIVPGGQRQEFAGNTIRLIGAYHSIQADTVIAAISTEATGDSIEYGYSDTYLTEDRREVAATEYVGDDTPRKGREGPYVVTFNSVDLPGTLLLNVFTSKDFDEATLEFDLQP